MIFFQTSAPDLTTIYKIYIVKKRWICVFRHLRKRSDLSILLTRPPCERNFMQLLKDLFVLLLMLPQTDFIVFGIDPVILGIHYK